MSVLVGSARSSCGSTTTSMVMSDAEDYARLVSTAFPDAATAAAQREMRASLATGPAIGQGGTYEERFDVTSSAVSDRVATLALSPVREHMDLVSDLTGGPLMFAWCGR